MKVAVVGTGISGLVASRALHAGHELDVYEAADRIGGHTHTVDVPSADGPIAVDTGFIVFNEATYPRFCALLRELGVAWQPSTMSFSVRCEGTGLEYNGTSLGKLFAQRSNLLRPSFWRMLSDVMRFYREASDLLERPEDDMTLGEYLEWGGYSRAFVEHHIVPMGSAVWSTRPDEMLRFPMRFLVQFFHNHGFLRIQDRPQWLVVRGGSRSYVEALVAPFRDKIRLATPVARVTRVPAGVLVRTATGEEALYDRVVLATHGDQALRLLGDPTLDERVVLGAFRTQRNDVVLHTDDALMPRRRRAWASWNYHVTEPASDLPTVTYWMNELQRLPDDTQYFVTLNREDAIDPRKIVRRFVYHHPIHSTAAVRAQARHAEIDGAHGVHFCGAYWSYGFHEDGVRSGLTVAERLGSLEVARC